MLAVSGSIRVRYRRSWGSAVLGLFRWLPALIAGLFVFIAFLTVSGLVSHHDVSSFLNRYLSRPYKAVQPSSIENILFQKESEHEKTNKPSFSGRFVRDLIHGVFICLLPPGVLAVIVTLILSLLLVGCRFWLQEHCPRTGKIISRFPNTMMETLPQIFWLFLISRFLLDSSSPFFYYIWYPVIAMTYSPVVTDQLLARIEKLREQNYILAEKVVGEKKIKTFFRDIIGLQCLDILLVQAVYLFSNMIVMEACMDFLAQISPSSPSLGALLYQLYEEDVIHSYPAGIIELIGGISGPLWITLILFTSIVLILRNGAAKLEALCQ